MPKVTKKVRGSARYYDDDSMEFIPQQEGEPKMRNAVKVGKSTAYTTNGEKQQSFVMHISVPDNDDGDAIADAAEVFDSLCKKMKRPATHPRFTGRTILREEGLTVKVDRKNAVISIQQTIALRPDVSWQEELNKKQIKTLITCINNLPLIQSCFRAASKTSTPSQAPEK